MSEINRWIFERINIPITYAKCPFCGYSLNLDHIRVLPYFCGGCGAKMKIEDAETASRDPRQGREVR